MFFELVSILFAIVPDNGNEYMTKENKNWTSFKNFATKLNLDHNNCTLPEQLLLFVIWNQYCFKICKSALFYLRLFTIITKLLTNNFVNYFTSTSVETWKTKTKEIIKNSTLSYFHNSRANITLAAQ